MKHITKLIVIGLVSGSLLALLLILIYLMTGNKAYILLFNVDYIPLLRDIWSQPWIGIVFHFIFCIVSVIGLFFILQLFLLERKVLSYVVIFTVGSAILFYLTALSNKQPAAGDHVAWLYWTCAHILFGLSVGFLVKRWIRRN